jgi:hypothetical protein
LEEVREGFYHAQEQARGRKTIDAHLDRMMENKQAPRVILALIRRDLRASSLSLSSQATKNQAGSYPQEGAVAFNAYQKLKVAIAHT